MRKIITKDGRKYEIEKEPRLSGGITKKCLTFSIGNDFDYDICATKKLIKFGWELEEKKDDIDIEKRLEKIGFEKLKERLENNNWDGCDKLENGNYREVLRY